MKHAANTSLTQDARNRALRSFLQGLGIDVLTAVAMAVTLWLPDADLSSRDAWLVLATGLARTVLGSVASYIMRAKLDASVVPTPLPPAPVPVPNDDEPAAPAGLDPSRVVIVADQPLPPQG